MALRIRCGCGKTQGRRFLAQQQVAGPGKAKEDEVSDSCCVVFFQLYDLSREKSILFGVNHFCCFFAPWFLERPRLFLFSAPISLALCTINPSCIVVTRAAGDEAWYLVGVFYQEIFVYFCTLMQQKASPNLGGRHQQV